MATPSKACGATALITIGLPGSGKSSLARQFCDQGVAGCWVSTDQIRQQLFGAAEVQGPWPFVEQQLLAEVAQAFEAEQTVLLDATHGRRRQRRKAVMQLRDAGFEQVLGLWLDVPVGLCQRRNRRRERVVPADVIRRMQRYLRAAPPNLSEGLTQLWRGRLGHGGGLQWRAGGRPSGDRSLMPMLSTEELMQLLVSGASASPH